MSLVKYRLKEVAADFGVAPKVIADIISKYFQKPKSNTQVLTDEELNLVFDSMTQTHQIASLEQVFAVKPAPKAEPPKPEAPKAEAPKQEAQQAAGVAEPVNTWAGWKAAGYMVEHGAKALFQAVLIHSSKGDGQTYRASFFGASQVKSLPTA